MAGGSKSPVTPVLGDSIPSSMLWLSGAQVLTIHTDIHIVKKNNKIILKPPMKRNLKTRITINNQTGLRKKFHRPALAFGEFLGAAGGGVSKGGGGSAQGALHLGSPCLSAQSASIHTVTSQDQSHHSYFLKNQPHSRQGLPPMLAVPIRYHALRKK